MRLTVLGSNAMYPTPGHPASGYLVAEGDTLLWLDAGPGTLGAFLEVGDPARLSAMLLTHVHGDHCLDVLPLFNLLRYGSVRDDPLPVLAPPGVAERLAGFVGAGPDHAFFRLFDFETLAAGERFGLGALRVSSGEMAHSAPTLGVRVEAGDASLTYSADTGPGGDLAGLAAGTSVLLCEATDQGRRPVAGYPYHLYAPEAGCIAREAAAGRLLVTHVTPTLDPAVSVSEAAAEFDGPVEWASPGLEVDV